MADTVIVRSPGGAELVGLDLADGHQVWRLPTPFSSTLRYDGITDAGHLILSDGTTVHAIAADDGSLAWSMPLPPSGRPAFRTTVRAMGGRMVTVTAQEFTGYTPRVVGGGHFRAGCASDSLEWPRAVLPWWRLGSGTPCQDPCQLRVRSVSAAPPTVRP
ncbi:PQQ-binding-like beta-propeller repeat protein [Nocardia fusca]|uniref:outer membrane protein assembly factor BamB family protein n=1 Tax=Nocardia fusca TaxID=941183 RepID=UPI0037C61F70